MHEDPGQGGEEREQEAPEPRARRDRRERDEGGEQAEDDPRPRERCGAGSGSRPAGSATLVTAPPSCPRTRADEPEHHEVHADEQDHEALDQQREVRRELWLEDARVQVAGGRPGEERAEQERGEAGPDRRVAAEERDGDPDEPDLRGLDVARRRGGTASRGCRSRRRGPRTRRRSPSPGSSCGRR